MGRPQRRWREMHQSERSRIMDFIRSMPHLGTQRTSCFEKETDTLDGWFDSGSTHYAAMKKDQGFWPATVYMEGLDQYRGWGSGRAA